MSLNLNWYKSYDTKPKNAKNTHLCFFYKIIKNQRWKILHFATSEAITFEPIEVQTRCTPQNDRVSLSFVKYEDTYGKKWPETIL